MHFKSHAFEMWGFEVISSPNERCFELDSDWWLRVSKAGCSCTVFVLGTPMT